MPGTVGPGAVVGAQAAEAPQEREYLLAHPPGLGGVPAARAGGNQWNCTELDAEKDAIRKP
jgi:hypothetical protein